MFLSRFLKFAFKLHGSWLWFSLYIPTTPYNHVLAEDLLRMNKIRCCKIIHVASDFGI